MLPCPQGCPPSLFCEEAEETGLQPLVLDLRSFLQSSLPPILFDFLSLFLLPVQTGGYLFNNNGRFLSLTIFIEQLEQVLADSLLADIGCVDSWLDEVRDVGERE